MEMVVMQAGSPSAGGSEPPIQRFEEKPNARQADCDEGRPLDPAKDEAADEGGRDDYYHPCSGIESLQIRPSSQRCETKNGRGRREIAIRP